MNDISARDRTRYSIAVVVGALGAITFMVSAVLPDAWYQLAMFSGATVAVVAFATIVATLTAP